MSKKKRFPSQSNRRTIYMPQKDWLQLKALLALRGLTISEWLRERARELLNEK